MSRETTAVVMVSPRDIGPWADRLWRFGGAMQLVEGGGSSYWTSVEPNPRYEADSGELVIEEPGPRAVVDSLLLWVAATWAHDDLLGQNRQALVEVNDRDQIGFSRTARLGPRTRTRIENWCSNNARLAILRLAEDCLVGDAAIDILRVAGIEFEIFERLHP